MNKKKFDRLFIKLALFFKVDIVMLLSDELNKAHKRNIKLERGCLDALNVIPNCIIEHPAVKILQDALYHNTVKDK